MKKILMMLSLVFVVTFLACKPEPVVPEAPVVTATVNGQNSITLTWGAVESATSYHIYVGDATKPIVVTETSYTVTDLTADTEYTFVVKAVNEVGESEASNVVTATTEKPKEGEYKPQRRISKIYGDYGDGKELMETWKWNNNILQSIEHHSFYGDNWTEEFTYNKNGQIERVEDFLNGEYTEYEYDGNKISKALFYCEGSVYMELDFKYTDNKITKIEVIGYDYKKGNGNRLMSKGYNPIKMLLTEKTYKVFEEFVNNPINRGGICTINLTWKDDNVSKIELKDGSYSSYSIVVDLKYDDKSNPFRSYYPLDGPGVYYEEGVYDGELPFSTFSVNNITEERWVENDEGDKYTWLVKNSYSYEGMYPTTKRIFTQDEDGDTDTVVFHYEYE